MDADVYGPSVPHLFGITEMPRLVGENRIQPIEAAGVKILSMGLLIPPEQAVVWRGPMPHKALTQFVQDTLWGDLITSSSTCRRARATWLFRSRS